MKTRKQKTPVSKRAQRQPAKRGAATRQPAKRGAATRQPAKRSGAPRRPAAARRAAAAAPAESRAREDGSLSLAAECTVAEAETLKAELARRLDESGPVTVDVSALQRIDTAALQLLAAFVRDRRTAGRPVAWRGRASALEAAANLLGLNDILELSGEVSR